MSRIRSSNTSPELTVRKYLHSHGFRYRLHYPIVGKPDIVFPKLKVAILIHGCFWHRHHCRFAVLPKTNRHFWHSKLNSNVERDKRVRNQLRKKGWRVKTIWECQIRKSEQALKGLEKFIESSKKNAS